MPSFAPIDRKSTRLNSSHRCSSHAVFCLKKKVEGCGTLRRLLVVREFPARASRILLHTCPRCRVAMADAVSIFLTLLGRFRLFFKGEDPPGDPLFSPSGFSSD